MPGIVGIVNRDSLNLQDTRLAAVAAPLVFAPEQEVQWFRHEWYCAGTVGYGESFSFLKRAHAYLDDVLLVMEGEVFPDASEVPPELSNSAPTVQRAEYCLYLYLKYGPGFVQRLNGTFTIAVCDGRDHRVHLYSDRFGSAPLYVWTSDAELVFATGLRSLLFYHDAIGREYDRDAVAELVVFERVLGDKTLFRDIRRLVPASHAVWDGRRLKAEKYWEVTGDEGPGELCHWRDAAAELWRRVKGAVARRSGDGARIGALVSGGIDSRLLVAACPKHVFAATFTNRNHPHSIETLLAMKVARVLGVEHKCLEREMDHYATVAELAVDVNEAQMSFMNSHSLGLHQQMLDAGMQVVLTAFWWDTLFKGYYHSSESLTGSDRRQEPDALRARRMAWELVHSGAVRKLDHQLLMMLALTKEMKERASAVKEAVISQLSCLMSQGGVFHNRQEQCFLCDLQSDAAIGFQRGLRTCFLDRSPAYDNELLALSLQIPAAWKHDGRIVRYALGLADPRLGWIKDANTGVPARLCPPWNRVLGSVRQSIRNTAKGLACISKTIARYRQPPGGGKIFKQHDSWHDMNGMLRLCTRYRDLVEDVVEQLDETLFDRGTVRVLLRDDLCAPAPRMHKLFEIILTFGLFDRAYGPSRSRDAVGCKSASTRIVDLTPVGCSRQERER